MKKTVFLLISLISLVALDGQAQKTKQKKASRSIDIAEPYSHAMDSGRYYLDTAPVKSISFLTTALRESINNKDYQRQAQVYNQIGLAYFNTGNFDLASSNYKKGIQLFKSKKTQKINDLYLNIAESEEYLGDFPSALRYLEQYRKSGTTSIYWERTGRVHLKNKAYAQAETNLGKALKIYQKNNDQAGVLRTTEALGSIFQEQNKSDQALNYYGQSKVAAEELKDPRSISKSNKNISSVYRSNKQFEDELEVQKEELQRGKQAEDKPTQRKANLNIANIYLEQDNEEEAIPYLEESLGLAGDSEEDLLDKKEAYKSLSSAYKEQGNYDKALENFQNYAAVVDSLYQAKEKNIASSNALQKDLFTKNQRLGLLEKDRELTENKLLLLEQKQSLNDERLQRQRLINYGLMFVIVVILVSAVLLFKNVQQKKMANQMLALKSLRSQMNPHFIFNALNSVNGFIAQNDQRAANKYLSEFSKLMRTVMENSQKEFVPLSTEIQMLQRYLKLEHFRFQEKFEFDFKISKTLVVDNYSIPPMLIQPYIENAVWHGLRYKETKGFLSVEVYESMEQLWVEIKDDGIGRAQSKSLKTKNQQKTESTGLKNIDSRIKIINDMYKTGLKIEISDLDPSQKECGTQVKIGIPFRTTEKI